MIGDNHFYFLENRLEWFTYFLLAVRNVNFLTMW